MKLSRRDFLKGTAAAGAAFLATQLSPLHAYAEETQNELAPGQYPFEIPPVPVQESEIGETLDTELCIIGAGQSGTTAALTAAYLGAKAVVLQKGPSVHTHGRVVCAVDTAFSGARYDHAELLSYWSGLNGGLVDPRILKLFIDQSGECFDWFNQVAEENGIEYRWETYTGQLLTDDDSGQMMIAKWSDGSFYHRNYLFCNAMTSIAQAKGVVYRFNCPGKYLERDDTGRVTGVIAYDEETQHYVRVNASKGVIVCTGDIGNDQDMIRKYATLSVGVPSIYSGAYNTGDGQKMLLWAGAQMEKKPYCSGIHLDPTALPEGNAPFSDYPFLAINSNGVRFMDESCAYEAKVASALLQTDIVYYQIGGSDMKDYCENNADQRGYLWEDAVKNGAITEADTLEELADKIGVPAEKLVETAENYNRYYETGNDTEFGKKIEKFAATLIPEAGPYYAIKRCPSSLCVFGGACTTPRLQVIDANDEPIEGLYVAGNTVGRMYGYEYPEEMGGTLSGRALAFGRLAARFALGDL